MTDSERFNALMDSIEIEQALEICNYDILDCSFEMPSELIDFLSTPIKPNLSKQEWDIIQRTIGILILEGLRDSIRNPALWALK